MTFSRIPHNSYDVSSSSSLPLITSPILSPVPFDSSFSFSTLFCLRLKFQNGLVQSHYLDSHLPFANEHISTLTPKIIHQSVIPPSYFVSLTLARSYTVILSQTDRRTHHIWHTRTGINIEGGHNVANIIR